MSELLGRSPAMERLRSSVARLGPMPLPVLIRGETGTGKELVARALHEHSGRTGQFVAVDCGALSPSLVESELFGHERGAFTGAVSSRGGLVAAAEGGTFFLDEIGELSLELQTRLLRLIESRTYRPVGAQGDRSADLRIVAASWRNLAERVAEGLFRQDLYHRLAVIELELPALRDRPGDVDFLLERFLAREAEQLGRSVPPLSTALRRHLRRWPWPGNVRELLNTARYLVAMSRGEATVDDLPRRLRAPLEVHEPTASGPPVRSDLPYNEARRAWLDHFQQQYVAALLDEHDGNVSAAARASGMDRRSIQRILKRAAERA